MAIYAAHRNLVIPLHHTGGCFLLWLGETLCLVPECKSSSPTRWFGGSLKVPWGRRVAAYTALRGGDFFTREEAEKLNIAHAESGLIVMTSVGFLVAGFFAFKYPCHSDVRWVPAWIGLAFLVASYVGPLGQHRAECWRMQTRRADVERYLRRVGIL